MNILVVGAGLSGAVVAQQLASHKNVDSDAIITVIDKRNHLGGNCYDKVDEDTGIRVSEYGAHIFHTDNERVWKYVNCFSDWIRWDHRVIGRVGSRPFFPIPVNMNTINVLCGTNLKTQQETSDWLARTQIKWDHPPENSEQMALSRVGEVLYNTIFKSYTIKQWGKTPKQLRPEVLARIPVRDTTDDRYFNDRYQALPSGGYTAFISNMLSSNPNIRLRLGCDFSSINPKQYNRIIYTGPIDHYFSQAGYPSLEYRSLRFETERLLDCQGYYQPMSVVNYPGPEVSWTRVVEYKHFPWTHERNNHTLIVKEYSIEKGEPYYPVLTDSNLELYKRYQELACMESQVYFLGRLATFKYINMDQAIANALEFIDNNSSSII